MTFDTASSILEDMARKVRIEYEGAIYHVMNRGDRQERIFVDDRDRERFVKTLEEACTKTDWQVHAYCLMPNHFHLLVETPKPNLVAGMRWLLGTYTGRFNRRHQLTGHLFAGRYKAPIVEGSGNGYLKTVCQYVHLNPARAGLIGSEQHLKEFRWSSFPAYLEPPRERPWWLRTDRVFGEMGIPRDSKAGRRELERLTEAARRADEPEDFGRIRRGWCFGQESFRKELLEAMSSSIGREHYGPERRETMEQKAESIIAVELRKRRLSEDRLARMPKADRAKLEIASRLRSETTMPVAWIADRLKMGARSYAYRLLYLHRRARSESQ